MPQTVDVNNWERLLDEALQHSVDEPRSPEAKADHARSATQSPQDPPLADQVFSVGDFRRRVIHSIRHSMTLPEDVCDADGAVLLSAGELITTRFFRDLQERGVDIVRLRCGTAEKAPAPPAAPATVPARQDESELHSPESRKLDARMAEVLQKPLVFHEVKPWRRPQLSLTDLRGHATRGLERHQVATVAVQGVCEALKAGRNVSAQELQQAVIHFVDMATLDFDLLPTIVALQQSGDEYLFDHGVNTALVSMAVAAHLGLDREAVQTIGLGGLLHDIGMLRVPLAIRTARRALTEPEWHQVRRHPIHTLSMMTEIRGLPQEVRFIAYQVHERGNGDGYPRRRTGRQMHPFAKIVSIADVYAAMTRLRPYRKAHSPYEAARTILMDVTTRRLDARLTRAFLDVVSLFPIGSCVGLSDGTQARVIRATPGKAARPIVEELTADGCPTGHLIDLSKEEGVRVTTAS